MVRLAPLALVLTACAPSSEIPEQTTWNPAVPPGMPARACNFADEFRRVATSAPVRAIDHTRLFDAETAEDIRAAIGDVDGLVDGVAASLECTEVRIRLPVDELIHHMRAPGYVADLARAAALDGDLDTAVELYLMVLAVSQNLQADSLLLAQTSLSEQALVADELIELVPELDATQRAELIRELEFLLARRPDLGRALRGERAHLVDLPYLMASQPPSDRAKIKLACGQQCFMDMLDEVDAASSGWAASRLVALDLIDEERGSTALTRHEHVAPQAARRATLEEVSMLHATQELLVALALPVDGPCPSTLDAVLDTALVDPMTGEPATWDPEACAIEWVPAPLR